VRHHIFRLLVLVALTGLALQTYFCARIFLMSVVPPQSTTLQRSEAWRLITEKRAPQWRQQWVPYSQISSHLKRAVVAAEDAGFAEHSGVDWDALEKAWERNQKAEERAEQLNQRMALRAQQPIAATGQVKANVPRPTAQARLVGGSTITQQLAKNLFLGSERSLARKAQEFVITFMLESLLTKQRILEIYLNHVEWGEGVFGAEAAAQHYFRVSAVRLSAVQAAQLAVMLPAPKRFEQRMGSAYLRGRAATIAARMQAVELP
jgi:monofunctional glycosyltransferase